MAWEAGVSPGCTRADNKITGLFYLNLYIILQIIYKFQLKLKKKIKNIRDLVLTCL